MEKAAWRLILNSIATTIFLTLLGEPILDATAIIGMFCVFLWLQEEVIMSIAGRRDKYDRGNRTASR